MGFIVKAVKSVAKVVGKVVKGVVGVVSKVVGGLFGFTVKSGAKGVAAEAKQQNTLNKNLDPEASRKIVFGRTAAPLDLRYWEVYGASGNAFVEVIALASHRINAVLELYLENDLAISAAGVVQTKFNGVLTRTSRLGLPGQTALSVGSGSKWNGNSTFTGCAHIALHWLPDEKRLPNGIPSRYSQVIEGAPVYDPRRDSTMGGSGPHRINDRTTWEYATLDGNGQPIGRNNALQALWYLLGWYIPNAQNGELVLVAGRGVFPEDINLSTFIAGANACEIAGYYTDMVLSTEDDHTSNEDKITCDGLIGRLIDPGGLWSYYANVDDTANVSVELTDADILDSVAVSWNEYRGMSEQFNQIGGKFINPSAITLFQPFPYPLVRDAVYEANLGLRKRRTQDFSQILDYVLAQRLARLALNEAQYQGEFSAGFMARAMKAQAWSIVRYTSERFGFVKLFRVWRHEFSTEAGVAMLLKEVHPSIWTAGTVNAALTHGQGNGYNPTQEIPLAGLTVNTATLTGPGTNPTIVDAFSVEWTNPPETARRTEIRYRIVGTSYWETIAPIMRGSTATVIFPLVRGANYEVEARHVSVHEVPGPWSNVPKTAGTAGNITYAGIVSAGSTADVGSLTDTASGVNPNRIDVLTALGISSGFAGQKALATLDAADWLLHVTGETKPFSYATLGENLIRNSKLLNQAEGWTLNSATLITNEAASGNFFRATVSRQPLAAKVPVPGGKRLYVSFEKRGSAANMQVQFFLYTFDKDGVALDAGTIPGWSNQGAGAYMLDSFFGAAATWAKLKNYIDLPPSVHFIRAGPYIICGAGQSHDLRNVRIATTEEDATFGADVASNVSDNGVIVSRNNLLTSLGIASGFTGQKQLATRDFIRLGYQNVTDPNYGGIISADGNSWETDARLRTSLGISSGFTGQKALATQDSVAYGSAYVTGFKGLAAKAGIRFGVNAGDADWHVPSNENLSYYISDNHAITSLGVSSGFTGQKQLATRDYIRLGYQNITDPSYGGIISADGSTWETDARLRTSVGISSGFTGQKALATEDYADFTTRVTGVGKPSIWATPGNNLITDPHMQTPLGTIWSSPAYYNGSGSGSRYINAVANGGAGNVQFPNAIPHGTRTLYAMFEGYRTNGSNQLAQDMTFVNAAGAYVGAVRQSDFGNVEWRDSGGVISTGWAWHKVPFHNIPNSAAYMGFGITSVGYEFSFGCIHVGDTPKEGNWRTDRATQRITDPRFYNTQMLLGPSNTTNLNPTYTVGGSNVTVNLPAHYRRIAGRFGPVDLYYGAASGVVAFSAYWIAYIDDLDLIGNASPTVNFTSNPNDLLYPGRYQIASGTAPAAGNTGGDIGSGGGGGYRDNCVAAYSWVETLEEGWILARYVKPGHHLRVLNEDFTGTRWELCTANSIALAEAVRIETFSGISLDLAASTPIVSKTVKTGIYAPDAAEYELPIWRNKELQWEGCTVEPIGDIEVAHISCSCNIYLAGNTAGEGILTHNIYQYDTFKP